MDHVAELTSLSTKITSTIGGLAIIWTMFRQFMPYDIKRYLDTYIHKFTSYISPYDCFIVEEYAGDRMNRHELYISTKAYLSDHCSRSARTCRIELGKDSDRFLVSIGERVEVTDDFNGARIWWRAHMHQPVSNQYSGRQSQEERRYYTLTFHKGHRELIEGPYLKHVLDKGRAITVRNRQRRLFTNNPYTEWSSYFKPMWNHVQFQHPSTFDTLAMDPTKKQEIIDDLNEFRRGKEYYSRIGKAWKRGYLLYGPPGTGKSSMISAIANFLEYDIYDLELTTVKSNSELRKLFIETTGKSIIVIEDIDCTLDLTGKRNSNKSKEEEEGDGGSDEKNKRKYRYDDEDKKKVTLSGLLNFIDGLWSACGEERIIIFTTNHKEKLDPALIRTGRMDKHIEMSYCDLESFRVLAHNYLGIDSHKLYEKIRRLLEEVKITPADVAENLMCVGYSNVDAGPYLERLVKTLMERKEAVEEQGKDGIVEEVYKNNVSNSVELK